MSDVSTANTNDLKTYVNDEPEIGGQLFVYNHVCTSYVYAVHSFSMPLATCNLTWDLPSFWF